jgi:hypothetical protein
MWLLLWLVVFLSMSIPCGLVFGVAFSNGKDSVDILHESLILSTQARVSGMMDEPIDSVMLIAEQLQRYDVGLSDCSVPTDGDYDATALIRAFAAYNGIRGRLGRFALESIGINMMVRRGVKGSSAQYMWEVSVHPDCEAYAYVWSDAYTEGLMYGVCVSLNGSVTGPQIMSESSPPLVQAEQDLFSSEFGTENGSFLPIGFSVVNNRTLTLVYSRAVRCHSSPGEVYALSYAEKSLDQLGLYLKESIKDEGPTGAGTVIYVIEAHTGLIVAASVDDQTAGLDKNGRVQRVTFYDAEDSVIRETALYLKAKSGSRGMDYFDRPRVFTALLSNRSVIYTVPYKADNSVVDGIDWVIVFVVPYDSIYGKIKEMLNTSALIFVLCLLLGAIITWWTSRVCTRSIYAIARNDPEHQTIGSHCLEEFQILHETIKKASVAGGRLQKAKSGEEELIAEFNDGLIRDDGQPTAVVGRSEKNA